MGYSLRFKAKSLKGTELAEYVPDCLKFCDYLDSTSMATMKLTGYDILSNQVLDCEHDYVHRWTEIYRKSVLAKFYQLEGWFNANKKPITLMTLSGYQGGGFTRRTKPWLKDAGSVSRSVYGRDLTMEDTWENINVASTKLFKILRKEIPGLTYVWIIEPHKSGYPHYHVILFHEVSKELQTKIKTLWEQKYKAGSFSKGVDFSVRPIQESIKSLRNYLMKYVSKGFRTSGSKFDGSFSTWTPEELCFNAVAWKNHYRLFGCSRNLSKVMARPSDDSMSKSVIWLQMQLGNGQADYSDPLWIKTTEEFQEIRQAMISDLLSSISDPGLVDRYRSILNKSLASRNG